MSRESELVGVFAGNFVDAAFVRTLLESAGIDVFLKDETMGVLAPFYVTAAGVAAVKIVVARKDLHRAEPIVRDFLE